MELSHLIPKRQKEGKYPANDSNEASVRRTGHHKTNSTIKHLPTTKLKRKKSKNNMSGNSNKGIQNGDPQNFEIEENEALQVEESSRRKIKQQPIPLLNHIYEHLTTVAHVSIVTVSIYIVYLCFTAEFVLFTWHPLLLAIGWMCLMTEAVLMLTQENIVSTHISSTWRVRWHWILQIIAVGCSLIGFIIVVVNKELKGKNHLISYHGLFGLISMISALVPTCLSGIPALFNVELRKYISPKMNKLIHAVSGIVTVILGGVTMILSLYTHWFARRTVKCEDGGGVAFLLCFIAMSFGILWCLVRPCMTCYQRLTIFLK